MRRAAIILLCAACIGACKKNEEPSTVAPGSSSAYAKADTTKDDADADVDSDAKPAKVVIDEAVMKLCELPEPHFAFDSADLSPSAALVLDALAICFLEGPAKEKSMRLVGHADPRGDDDYNMGLGQRRAGHVSSYLAKKGLPENRMATSSRGELDAVGKDETSWAEDRRVDILLAEG